MRRAPLIRLKTILACAILALTLSCADADPAHDPLRIWLMNPAGEKPRELVAGISAAFTASHPGVAVEVEYIPWGDAKSKIKNALLGGVAPDICELGSTWTPEFSEGGVLLDLTDRVRQQPWADDFLPALRESGAWDGRLYGLPWYAGCRALIYRKDLFASRNLAPPATWDELIETAAALQATGPGGTITCHGLGLPGRSAHVFLPFIWSNGGEIMRIGSDGRWTPALTEPASLEAVRFIADIYTRHHLIPEGAKVWDAIAARSALANGRAAMIIDGHWAIPSIVKLNPSIEDQIGAALVPRSKQYASFAGGSHLVVFNTTRRPEEAWQYVSMFLDDANMTDWCETVGFFPGRASLMDEIVRRGNPHIPVFAEMMRHARTYPPVPAWGKFEESGLFETFIQKLFDGDSPEEATTWAEEEMQRISR